MYVRDFAESPNLLRDLRFGGDDEILERIAKDYSKVNNFVYHW